ncbi:hypothetical protein PHYSODRAFT_329840 [Phytophthora sojae]|uniref:Uncharacterized protein n=1 Tax=Phytophthora sojae (strain P6497) TaxID=1094619 RepID=G4Z9E8_PHYSP|nr:hypothetical protein PHYSODRAFT_329840 [Phytophthora sojae]EGZ21949.1 hypothetical protein PHYSODRAFT_329840 [Phytophthora sojae]|eukprot:XP_009524666.1 hypothetical protein PHYSODRAFT_329840 [Phytophthora sojae]
MQAKEKTLVATRKKAGRGRMAKITMDSKTWLEVSLQGASSLTTATHCPVLYLDSDEDFNAYTKQLQTCALGS